MPITNFNSTMLSLRTQLNSNISAHSTAMQRLSSGLKIKSASDGAADVVLSSKLNTRISGMTIAQKNTQNAIAMLDTADSSLSKMMSITSRIRDLSLQAMNGTYSDDERNAIQVEIDGLKEELYRQKNEAKFNQISLFGDDTKTKNLNLANTFALSSTSSLNSSPEVQEVNKTRATEKVYKAQLEYIETTGSEYIDTGIIGKTGLSSEIDVLLTKFDDDCLLGSRNGQTRIYLSHFYNNGYMIGYGTYTTKGPVILDEKQNIKTELYDGNQTVTVNGEVKNSLTKTGEINTNLNMYLFAMNYDNKAQYNVESGTRLYACKIYDEGVLVRDYIPVVDNNDVACLYDKVSGQFFYNHAAGGDTFKRGAELAIDPPTIPDPDPPVTPDPDPPDPPDTGPPDTGPPKERKVSLQVGSQAGIDNTIRIDLGFTLDNINFDVSTENKAEETLRAVDNLQKTLLDKQSKIGAVQNRLLGVVELQNNELINLKSANSIITDTDYAKESCNLVRSQILQQTILSLMGQCSKQTSNLAMRLLNFA